jgi:hypothetical protein
MFLMFGQAMRKSPEKWGFFHKDPLHSLVYPPFCRLAVSPAKTDDFLAVYGRMPERVRRGFRSTAAPGCVRMSESRQSIKDSAGLINPGQSCREQLEGEPDYLELWL